MNYKIKKQSQKNDPATMPDQLPVSDNVVLNEALDSVRAFEIEQMSYKFSCCNICHERRLEMLMANKDICKRCSKDTLSVKQFSSENNMDPCKVPPELSDLTFIEEQLICRNSPCMNVHMLKHDGIASSGHCVTFPQDVDEPAQIFPRLPKEIQILKVKKSGLNDSSKEFRVRRLKVQNALDWLKENNPAYSDIIISNDRLAELPLDDSVNVNTFEYKSNTTHQNDQCPAPDQEEPGDVEGATHSCILLSDQPVNIRQQVQAIVDYFVSNNTNKVTMNRQGTVSIPWPTRGNVPLSEFTSQYFFTLAFPSLFPFGTSLSIVQDLSHQWQTEQTISYGIRMGGLHITTTLNCLFIT